MTRSFAFGFIPLLLLACGGAEGSQTNRAPRVAPDPDPKLERWETRQEWLFHSKERCVTGPFTVNVPERDFEFARRFTVEVFGERLLPFDSQLEMKGSTTAGWGWSSYDQKNDAHSSCRAHLEADIKGPNSEPVTKPRRSARLRKTKRASTRSGQTESAEKDERLEPKLSEYTGSLPPRHQSGGWAWFPSGYPRRFQIDDISTTISKGGKNAAPRFAEHARGRFRFTFWFHNPVDMKGMVIRFSDQVLVPTEPIEEYRARYAARVQAVEHWKKHDEVEQKHRQEQQQQKQQQTYSKAHGRVPPPPKREPVPPAPGDHVMWLPGYWQFHDELDQFVWIEGTYVVRVEKEKPNEQAAAAEDTSERNETEVEVTVQSRPRPVTASIPTRPAPKTEIIPTPPKTPGAQWIRGYWELDGRSWHWVSGRWQLPKKRGVRFRAPSIEVRGKVRVYIPGGWFFGSR